MTQKLQGSFFRIREETILIVERVLIDSTTMSSHENLSPQVLGRLMKELRKLSRSPPEGIKFIPNSDDNIGEIHAEIDGPVGTPFTGGAWRVKLVLSQDFPNS